MFYEVEMSKIKQNCSFYKEYSGCAIELSLFWDIKINFGIIVEITKNLYPAFVHSLVILASDILSIKLNTLTTG